MTMVIPSWAVAAIIGLIGLAFTMSGFFYARVKSASDKAKEDGRIIEKLSHLEKKVDKINDGYDTQQEKCSLRGERLALVEASSKSSHLRIDGLDVRMKELVDLVMKILRNAGGEHV